MHEDLKSDNMRKQANINQSIQARRITYETSTAFFSRPRRNRVLFALCRSDYLT